MHRFASCKISRDLASAYHMLLHADGERHAPRRINQLSKRREDTSQELHFCTKVNCSLCFGLVPTEYAAESIAVMNRNLVKVECMTISAPKFPVGRWKWGDMKVLSTLSSTPRWWQMSATAADVGEGRDRIRRRLDVHF